MTKDNCSIKLQSVLYWRVVAPYEAEFGVANVSMALIERCVTSCITLSAFRLMLDLHHIRARTVLRNVCGQHTLQDLIENRDAVSREIQKTINPAALNWGVEVCF